MGVQMLPHFYAEDLVNVMNKERRREALAKFVGIIKADIEREKKGRAGVENLAKALHETPKFGGEESQVRGTTQILETSISTHTQLRYERLI